MILLTIRFNLPLEAKGPVSGEWELSERASIGKDIPELVCATADTGGSG